jgi:hypothetical protein
MRARLTKLLAGLTVVGALAFGGATLASAAGNGSGQPADPGIAVQQGDQTTPDVGGTSAESSSESASSESACSWPPPKEGMAANGGTQAEGWRICGRRPPSTCVTQRVARNRR